MANNSSSLSSSSGSKMSKCKEARRYLPAAVAWILLLSTTALFFIFPAQWFYHEYSIWILVGEGIVTLFVVSMFSLATFMDPGILPKPVSPEDDNDDHNAPLYNTAEVRGMSVRMKWCITCQFYRPPRCSHCSVCDHCIETFDHHCPWVNNCIGRRNYRYFFGFLISLSLHMIIIFCLCLVYLLHHLEKVSDLHTIISVSIMGVITILCIPVCGLAGFHIVLVSRGRTTNEQVTGRYTGGLNPYSKGCCFNCYFTLCYLIYPKLHKENMQATRDVDVTMVYRASGDRQGQLVYQANNSVSAGNQVKVYTDNGACKKPRNISLPSLHSPRDYQQMLPVGGGGERNEIPLLQASQSLDCEPTPPMQRQGSKSKFFLPKKSEESTGPNNLWQTRGVFSHGSPHPNRQNKDRNAESNSIQADSSVCTTPGPSFPSPTNTMQQRIRAIGGVPTPFTPPGGNFLPNQSHATSPTHSAASTRGLSRVTQNPPASTSKYRSDMPSEPENFSAIVRNVGYDAVYNAVDSSRITQQISNSGPIRDLANSPQRSSYHWEDATILPMVSNHHLENGRYLQNSNPDTTHPVHHSLFSDNGSSSNVNSQVQPMNRDYYSSSSANPPFNVHQSTHAISQRPNAVVQQQRRPVDFVQALAMSEPIDTNARRFRNNRPQEAPNSPNGDTRDRASVYDMNYEISV